MKPKAFTLAELLIALTVLGVITTFTIPKVLQSSQDQKNKAIAKEAAGALSEAFQRYKLEQSLAPTTHIRDIAQYINYVAKDSTSQVDTEYNVSGNYTCVALATGNPECLQLHNGAMLYYFNHTFCGVGNNNVVGFSVDPDRLHNVSSSTGQNKAIPFLLYANGAIRTQATAQPGSQLGYGGATCDQTINPSANDPPWFSWN